MTRIVETFEQALARARNAKFPEQREPRRRRTTKIGTLRAIARLEICRECPHHNDDYDGRPLDPPCRLMNGLDNKRWTICRWRGWLQKGAPHPDNRCPWNATAGGV